MSGSSRSTPWDDARRIAAAEASTRLNSASRTERVAVDEVAGRVIADDVRALLDIPHYDSSAMDGWAVAGPGPWTLVDAAGTDGHSGARSPSRLANGEAVGIVTGGLIPAGADAVLRSEHGTEHRRETRDRVGPGVALTTNERASADEPRHRTHIRSAGEEAHKGDVLIPARTLLNPVHAAVAAAAGHDELTVIRRPRVALIFTGSEVVTAGLPQPGRVRDAFGPQLPALLQMIGADVTSRTRLGDDRAALRARVEQHVEQQVGDSGVDIVITTGGTGDSSADHVRAVLIGLGAQIVVDGVAARPGGPSILARLPNGSLFVGLPGNPLAALMGFLLLVEPAVAELAGIGVAPVGSVELASALEGRDRTSLLVPYRADSDERALPSAWRQSGMMRGLAEAHGVLVCPPGIHSPGTRLETLALPWLAPNAGG